MLEPQEIEDREDEQAVARVAAGRCGQGADRVCTRVPREGGPGRFITTVWAVGATTNEIIELAAYLAGQRVEKVVLEPAGAWWRPFFSLMEAAGLHAGAGQRAGGEERAGTPEDGQARCGAPGQTGRLGDAAAQLRAARRDPPAAGLHPAAHRLDPRADPAPAAAGGSCSKTPSSRSPRHPAAPAPCRCGTWQWR
jgi:hypothetical protein